MQTSLQFRQSGESEQERAARVLARGPVPLQDSALDEGDFARFRDTPVDNYLLGRNLIAEANVHPTWFQTMGTRIAARVVTRGLFGALAFTWMQGYAGRAMRNYQPEAITTSKEWVQALMNPRVGFRNNTLDDYINRPNTMQAIAKAFDYTAGNQIQRVAHFFDPDPMKHKNRNWATKSVLFRQRSMPNDPISAVRAGAPFKPRSWGRSLGAEVVSVTADFAAASFGDALARNIVDTMDPNNTKAREAWHDAQGHFSASKFGWDWTKRLWRVVSFNQGEDWAAALPYVYFIKWHRNVIDRFSPGFKLASDNPQMQAASDKLLAVFDHGGADRKLLKIEHIGTDNALRDFQKEGAWDLHARFVMYNVFTLMFRETYTKIGNGLTSWWKGDSWLPEVHMPKHPLTAPIEAVADSARYAVKSFIKANLYMNPAVPFFWSFRTSQSKWQGSPIVAKGVFDKDGERHEIAGWSPMLLTTRPNTARGLHEGLGEVSTKGHSEARAQEWKTAVDNYLDSSHKELLRNRIGWRYGPDTYIPAFNQDSQHGQLQDNKVYIWGQGTDNHPYRNGYPLYRQNVNGLFGVLTQPLGRMSYHLGTILTNALQSTPWLKQKTETIMRIDPNPSPNNKHAFERSIRTFVDASMAYTPYMIAKAETAMRWDNPDMDRATYRLIDGVASFNVSEVKKAISEIGTLLTHPRVRDDNSPNANVNPVDASLRPTTRIHATGHSHGPLVHAEHRTLQ